jgi:hypothetical protein
MPTVEQDKQAALARLRLLAAYDVPPKLTDPELIQILEARQIGDYWKPGTVYAPGAKVIPATANGRIYKAVSGGTSGQVEPNWSAVSYDRFTDGTVTWQEAGAALSGVFDLEGAVYDAWGIKEGRASVLFATDHSQQQVFDHCRLMRQRSRPVRIA